MSSGYITGTQDLDVVFAPYVTGTLAAASNYFIGSQDLSSRYAPLIYGTQAAATGFLTVINGSVVDLNTLYAAYGTTQYILPINGVKYSAVTQIPAGSTGTSTVSFGFVNDTEYFIKTTSTSSSGYSYTFSVPSGMTQVKLTLSYLAGSGIGVTTGNNATTLTNISTSISAFLQLGPLGPTSGTHEILYSLQVQFANSAGDIVWTGTCQFYCETDGSA